MTSAAPMRNEEAARRCGFQNRLGWASAKKRLGIRPVKTREGSRFMLDRRQMKLARRIRWGMEVRT
jgi:hypothetical protein